MATNVAARVRDLKDDGFVPENARCQTLDRGLTYDEANSREVTLRNACGSHCQGSAGGKPASGNVWSIYRLDW